MDELKHFRQVGSITPGHPEVHITDGIEVSTGPLGQGIANAVGLAISEAHLAATFNKPDHKIIDHYTYVLCGDGCLQEGISGEASSLAGCLGLGKLILLYDDNSITIDGETELSFREDVIMRYEAYGWHTLVVEDGDTNVEAIQAAIDTAKSVTDKPSLIKVRTTIGLGSSKQGTEKVHGSPLGSDDLKAVKAKYGFDPEATFAIPEDVGAFLGGKKDEGATLEAAWNASLESYVASYPEEGADLKRRISGKLPEGWADSLPTYKPGENDQATRKYSSFALEKIVPAVPEFIGGSADLTPSTLTRVAGHKADFSAKTPEGRYLRYGVREHAMCAINNGIAAHGGLFPFASTFLVFTGYCIGAIRLAALSHLRAIYIFTHDSIGVGEDGPTHQPVESLANARAIPNLNVIRPADGNETSGAYKTALEQERTPSLLSFSRQTCPNLEGSSAEGVQKGAYILSEAPGGTPKVILTGSGSEVGLCAAAAKALNAAGTPTRVVSFPCFELFDQQDLSYRASVFPDGVPVLSVEAAVAQGWERYSHAHMGMTSFGASGPGDNVFKHFGFTPEVVVEKAQKLMAFYADGAPKKFPGF
jgi:transketolase